MTLEQIREALTYIAAFRVDGKIWHPADVEVIIPDAALANGNGKHS
jgi:hypothetical protein